MTVARRILPGVVTARGLAQSATVLGIIASSACRIDDPLPTDPVGVHPKSVASIGAALQGQYLVILDDSVTDVESAATRIVRGSNATVGRAYGRAVKGFSATMSESAAKALSQNPAVAFVEPDRVVVANETQPAAWATDRIDQRSLPLSETYSWTNTGAGVNVYILDSGILTTHTQLQGRARSVYGAFGDGCDATDCHGHGTFVAGLVGSWNYGVAKGVNLLSVRVLDRNGTGTTSSVIAGLNWLVANRELPAVANMSFGLPFSAALNQAVQAVISAGVTVTVSSGNISTGDQISDACQYSPASVAAAITVGGTMESDAMASWTKRGSCVDFFAPGHTVYSTGINFGNDGVANQTGSSASAALAAGAAALHLESNPGSSPSAVANALIAAATTGVLRSLDSASPNRLLYVGSGGSSEPPPPPPPAPPPTDAAPKASLTTSCRKLVCTLDGSKSTDDKGIVRYEWSYGDGTTGSSATSKVTKTYATARDYNVTLTVVDASGQRASASVLIRLKGR